MTWTIDGHVEMKTVDEDQKSYKDTISVLSVLLVAVCVFGLEGIKTQSHSNGRYSSCNLQIALKIYEVLGQKNICSLTFHRLTVDP